MITISSNLDGVIEEIRNFERDIPLATQRALNPKRWGTVAREAAAAALHGVADESNGHLVEKYVEQVTVSFWGTGMKWEMTDIQSEVLDLMDAVRQEKMGPLIQWANIEKAREAAELIEEWVRTEKRKDERDARLSDEQIARRLFYIFFGNSTERRAEAREKLLPHIQAFAVRKAASQSGLDEATKLKWFRAVMEGWVDVLSEQLPRDVMAEIMKLWAGKK